jgi:uncharacterized membrane protein YdfJ with MMPL/SSD domain
MEALTRFALRHRWLVLAGWFVAFLVCFFASSRLADLLTNRFTLPTDTAERRRSSRITANGAGRSRSSFRVMGTRRSSLRPCGRRLNEQRTSFRRAASSR